jgi:nucleotide-binding universal stress UspA family protein
MRFVVALDGSPQASVGAAFVRSLALGPADEVILASVSTPPVILGSLNYLQPDATSYAISRVIEAAAQAGRDEAKEITAREAVLFAGMSCSVAARVPEGHPLERLVTLVAETGADVIAVGPHGRDRLAALLFGSVTNGLLQAMPAAVLVARGPVRAPRRILLATDGSSSSSAAAALLARLPVPDGAEILAVSCVSRTGRLGREPIAGAIREHATMALGRAAATLETAGRNVRVAIAEGEPKEQILIAAEEDRSDLIVMGSRGIGGFRGLALGSVSRAVSKAARATALVVPEAKAAEHNAR